MPGFTITVGERTFICSGGRVTTEINKPDNASGAIGANDLAEQGADWAGLAHASIDNEDMVHGRVIEAQPEDGNVALSLRSATMLTESLLPPMVVQQIDGREVVYLVAREAGFEPGDINIDGLAEAVAFEPLWVLVPVGGLSIRQAVKVGVVELVSGDAGREMLLRFNPRLEAQFSEPLEDVGAFARVAVPARYMHEAEREGLALIDDAVVWLTTRLRYSWSHAPDGRLEPYERAAMLTVVERLPGVAVFPVAGSLVARHDRRPARAERGAPTGLALARPGDAYAVEFRRPPSPTRASTCDHRPRPGAAGRCALGRHRVLPRRPWPRAGVH